MPPHRRSDDPDAHLHAREEDRRQSDELEKRVGELAVGVIGLRGALENVGAVLKHDVEGLREEIDTQRLLSKYNRRTHFQVLFWVASFALQVGAGVHYLADNRAVVAGIVFWMWPYGPWPARLLGFGIQCLLLWIFWHRAQVPDDLFDRTPAGADGRRSYYNRVMGRLMGRVS